MKFAIVLLALVACAAAVPQERGIIQDVENMVNSAITNAKSDLASLGNLVQGLVANAETQVTGIIAGAKSTIYGKIDQLENQIAALIVKGGVVAFCAQANIAPLTDFKNNFGKNVESCAGGLTSTLGGFETSVLSEIASLTASVSELVVIAQECTSSFLDAAACALTKVNEVKTLISTIVSEGSDAVNNTRAKITASVSQIQTCAQQTIGEATITLNKFVTAVQACG